MSQALHIALLWAVLAAAAPARPDALAPTARVAQDPDQDGQFARLEVHVTAVSGISVYIDKGRADRLQRGDILFLYPSTGPQLRAVIRSVSKSSARAELDFDSKTAVTGDRGEVLMPKSRLATPEPESDQPSGKVLVTPGPLPGAESQPKADQQDLPDHPPWSADITSVDGEAPLLAPLTAQAPDERPSTMRGRAWVDYSTSTDNQGVKTTYDTLRTGFDVTFENAFGKGGELEIDSELYSRNFSSDAAPSESDSSVRVNRLNYLIGGDRTRPTSYQFGRFFSRGMSEFGVIDGFEMRHRLASGNSFGFNLGGLPVPNAALNTGDDVAVAVFHHWTRDADETLTLDSGFQKSWHKGKADRDLLVFTSNWRPAERTYIYASAWIDLYGTNDVTKPSGPELTQLFANATWRTKDGDGVGLSLSQYRIPELLRTEFDPVTASEILNSKTTRAGLNGWKKLGGGLKLRGRVDRWQDEEDSGGRFEAGLSARDRLYDGGTVELILFQDNNKFSSGPGARLTASKQTSKGWLRVSYETAETKNADFNGAQQTLGRDVLRASWDMSLGTTWDLSLNAESRSGDAEDATTIGIFLQKRFR